MQQVLQAIANTNKIQFEELWLCFLWILKPALVFRKEMLQMWYMVALYEQYEQQTLKTKDV